MASASLTLILVALLALSSSALVNSQTLFGGATSISQYGGKLLSNFNGAKYASVGSGAGIRGFTSGTYLVGAGDDPLSSAQDSAAGGRGKFHLPLTLGTYSFVTRKAGNIRLTASQVAGIYKGTITRWSQINSRLSGNIVPVARSDSSGTTQLVGTWIRRGAGSTWPLGATASASWNGVPGISRNVKYQAGSGGVASYVFRTSGAIGYVQTGIGTITFKNFGTGLLNPSRNYAYASRADPAQSIPRTLPPSDRPWAGVSLLNGSGRNTYPIVSFVYMFAKKKYRTTATGTTVRRFLAYTQTNAAQSIAPRYFFFRLPSKVINQNNAAIRTIT